MTRYLLRVQTTRLKDKGPPCSTLRLGDRCSRTTIRSPILSQQTSQFGDGPPNWLGQPPGSRLKEVVKLPLIGLLFEVGRNEFSLQPRRDRQALLHHGSLYLGLQRGGLQIPLKDLGLRICLLQLRPDGCKCSFQRIPAACLASLF